MIVAFLFALAQLAPVKPAEKEFTSEDYRIADLRGQMIRKIIEDKPSGEIALSEFFMPGALVNVNGSKGQIPDIQPFYDAVANCQVTRLVNNLLPPVSFGDRLVRDALLIETSFDCRSELPKIFRFVILDGKIISVSDEKLDG